MLASTTVWPLGTTGTATATTPTTAIVERQSSWRWISIPGDIIGLYRIQRNTTITGTTPGVDTAVDTTAVETMMDTSLTPTDTTGGRTTPTPRKPRTPSSPTTAWQRRTRPRPKTELLFSYENNGRNKSDNSSI